jgi:SAM-dependent methyltransferase
MTDNDILKQLQEFYDTAVTGPEGPLLDHLSNEVSLRSYIVKGRQMQESLGKGAQVLDWGAGFGQMTLILNRLGVDPVPYDVIRRKNNLFAQAATEMVFGTDPVRLPFPDGDFDGVLSCGVLEHVSNIPGSVAEVFRVLKPGGRFFIFNLPSVFSPSEYYATLKKISVHPVKFTRSGTEKLLRRAGFKVETVGFENGMPKRLSGPLRPLRGFFNRHQQLLLGLDRLIVNTPVLKLLLSNSLKVVARK